MKPGKPGAYVKPMNETEKIKLPPPPLNFLEFAFPDRYCSFCEI